MCVHVRLSQCRRNRERLLITHTPPMERRCLSSSSIQNVKLAFSIIKIYLLLSECAVVYLPVFYIGSYVLNMQINVRWTYIYTTAQPQKLEIVLSIKKNSKN